jgi:hypothetical protein
VKKKRKKAKGNAQERNSMTKNLSLTSFFSKINITPFIYQISRTEAQRLYPMGKDRNTRGSTAWSHFM